MKIYVYVIFEEAYLGEESKLVLCGVFSTKEKARENALLLAKKHNRFNDTTTYFVEEFTLDELTEECKFSIGDLKN